MLWSKEFEWYIASKKKVVKIYNIIRGPASRARLAQNDYAKKIKTKSEKRKTKSKKRIQKTKNWKQITKTKTENWKTKNENLKKWKINNENDKRKPIIETPLQLKILQFSFSKEKKIKSHLLKVQKVEKILDNMAE